MRCVLYERIIQIMKTSQTTGPNWTAKNRPTIELEQAALNRLSCA
jgi:hypothetical protein